jgi:hypothetical protein
MINAIDSEALMRIVPKDLPGFYEVSRLEDGDIIVIKRSKVRGDSRLAGEGKPEEGSVSDTRLSN